jgi:hypothetical protein
MYLGSCPRLIGGDQHGDTDGYRCRTIYCGKWDCPTLLILPGIHRLAPGLTYLTFHWNCQRLTPRRE